MVAGMFHSDLMSGAGEGMLRKENTDREGGEKRGTYLPQCWRRTSWTGHLSHPKGHQCPATDRYTQNRTDHHITDKGTKGEVENAEGQRGQSGKAKEKHSEDSVQTHQSTTKLATRQLKRRENRMQMIGNIRLVCQYCELTKEK